MWGSRQEDIELTFTEAPLVQMPHSVLLRRGAAGCVRVRSRVGAAWFHLARLALHRHGKLPCLRLNRMTCVCVNAQPPLIIFIENNARVAE